WAFSLLVAFVDLVIIFLRESRQAFARTYIVPKPVLLCCILAGSFVCVATIVDTLLFSFAPTLIPNSSWTIMIGLYALLCMILCAVTGMIASGETDIEQLKFDQASLQGEIARGKRIS